MVARGDELLMPWLHLCRQLGGQFGLVYGCCCAVGCCCACGGVLGDDVGNLAGWSFQVSSPVAAGTVRASAAERVTLTLASSLPLGNA